jgi:hypothetical protein
LELPEPLKLSHRLVPSLSDVIDVCSVSLSQSCSLHALSLLASPITLSVGALFLAYTDPVANIRQYTRVKPLGVYTVSDGTYVSFPAPMLILPSPSLLCRTSNCGFG